MGTKLILVASFLFIGISANSYKNSLVEKEFSSILQKNINDKNDLLFSDIECSGLFSISCIINDMSIKNDEISRLTIEELIINNIQDFKEFKNLGDLELEQKKEFLVKHLKDGIALDIKAKNINVHFEDKHKKIEIRKQFVQKLSHDQDGSKIIMHLFNTLDRGGLNLSLKAEFTGTELLIKEIASSNLSRSELSVKIKYEGSKLLNVENLKSVAKDAIFKEIKFDITEKEDFLVSSLYIIYKKMANSGKRKDLQFVSYINNQYAIKGDGTNLSFEKFKDLLRSKVTENILRDMTNAFKDNIKRTISDDMFDKIIDDSSLKLVSIINGDDNLSLTIQSGLSSNIINKEMMNFIYTKKTSKKINEYFTFEIK